MRIATLKIPVKDSFEPGECFSCPLAIEKDDAEHHCVMGYRYCDCPLRLELYTYAMDEEDITD